MENTELFQIYKTTEKRQVTAVCHYGYRRDS